MGAAAAILAQMASQSNQVSGSMASAKPGTPAWCDMAWATVIWALPAWPNSGQTSDTG